MHGPGCSRAGPPVPYRWPWGDAGERFPGGNRVPVLVPVQHPTPSGSVTLHHRSPRPNLATNLTLYQLVLSTHVRPERTSKPRVAGSSPARRAIDNWCFTHTPLQPLAPSERERELRSGSSQKGFQLDQAANPLRSSLGGTPGRKKCAKKRS